MEIKVSDGVYEPAEDSYMLTEAAKKVKGKVLEIGCGSGIVSLTCAKNGCEVLGVDINREAVKCAKENAKKNCLDAKFVYSDLFSKVGKQKFDWILFNPPYLPTEPEEKIRGKLNKAFDGGVDGRKTLDRFLGQFDKFLAEKGKLLLIQSSLNDLDKTNVILNKKSYKTRIIAQESFFFEKLYVLRAEKTIL